MANGISFNNLVFLGGAKDKKTETENLQNSFDQNFGWP